MSGIDYHGALAPLEEACRLTDYDMLYIDSLMRSGSTKDSLSRKFGIALRHLQLVRTVWANRHRDLIVVRDFSNVPLAVVFPLIRQLRSKIIFVVNHNLQWTLDSTAERIAFSRLGRWGCRFALLEKVPVELLEQYGIDPQQCVALPHPVPAVPVARTRKGGISTVGLIGQYRPEKGVDELLDVLEMLTGRYRILLALPNREDFFCRSPHAHEKWFDLVDTSDHIKYMQAITECDAVVLNHPPEGYAYRASGLIADAAAASVPVVTRDLFVMRNQLSNPVSIGECYDDIELIPDCLERISARLAEGKYDFASYANARNAKALAQQLSQLCSQIATV